MWMSIFLIIALLINCGLIFFWEYTSIVKYKTINYYYIFFIINSISCIPHWILKKSTTENKVIYQKKRLLIKSIH